MRLLAVSIVTAAALIADVISDVWGPSAIHTAWNFTATVMWLVFFWVLVLEYRREQAKYDSYR